MNELTTTVGKSPPSRVAGFLAAHLGHNHLRHRCRHPCSTCPPPAHKAPFLIPTGRRQGPLRVQHKLGMRALRMKPPVPCAACVLAAATAESAVPEVLTDAILETLHANRIASAAAAAETTVHSNRLLVCILKRLGRRIHGISRNLLLLRSRARQLLPVRIFLTLNWAAHPLPPQKLAKERCP